MGQVKVEILCVVGHDDDGDDEEGEELLLLPLIILLCLSHHLTLTYATTQHYTQGRQHSNTLLSIVIMASR
jgi:hypothetical protein